MEDVFKKITLFEIDESIEFLIENRSHFVDNGFTNEELHAYILVLLSLIRNLSKNEFRKEVLQ